jgi:hypothetical protein
MEIRANLSIIPDPRIERRKKHLLVDILLLCIIALVCGVEDIENIAFFGVTRLSWLNRYLALPNGIPGADTIRRLLARIDPHKVRGLFHGLDRGYFKERAGAGSVIAWAGELSLVPGQVQTAEKSNEITRTTVRLYRNSCPRWTWPVAWLLLTLWGVRNR